MASEISYKMKVLITNPSLSVSELADPTYEYVVTFAKVFKGDKGDSAYDIAVLEGFHGTEEEWLASLVGAKGDQGKSAYDIWLEKGHTGTEEDFIASLKGEKGDAAVIDSYSIVRALGYSPANNDNVVHTNGTEVITGAKLFRGGLDAGLKRITSVGRPVNGQDAATKDYVDERTRTDIDELVLSAGDNKLILRLEQDGYLGIYNKDGFAGALTEKTPTYDSELTNKKYVDQFYKKPLGGIPETDLAHAIRLKIQHAVDLAGELAGSILVVYDIDEMSQYVRDFSELNSYALIVIKGGDGGTILPSLFNDGDWLYQYQAEWRETNNHAFESLDIRDTFADLLMAFDEHSHGLDEHSVHTSGNETIGGVKSFTGFIVLSGKHDFSAIENEEGTLQDELDGKASASELTELSRKVDSLVVIDNEMV